MITLPQRKLAVQTTMEVYNALDTEEMDEPASILLSHAGSPIDEQVIHGTKLRSSTSVIRTLSERIMASTQCS